MPRIRTIKPELPQDVKLATASREARYTFVLLITQADDEGLVPGAHRQLLGLLYPHDEDVSTGMLLAWVEELVGVGAVRWRSTVDGAPILEITNWSKHQRVDNKGRSQLSGFLLPHGELPTLAAVRGDSRRDAATRGLDLGPRTMDQGPSSPPPAAAIARTNLRVAAPSADVEAVLAHYIATHPKRRPGPKDRKAVAKALGLGYSAAELCEAITGNATDEWHKDKAKHELPYVLRDNGLIDGFREKAAKAAGELKVVDGWFAA